MWMAEVARKVCTLGLLASFTASHATSKSLSKDCLCHLLFGTKENYYSGIVILASCILSKKIRLHGSVLVKMGRVLCPT